VRLRPATADDAAAVHALEERLFGVDAWSLASVREELTGEGRRAVVACHPDVVGYVVVTEPGSPQDPVDLLRVAVHPAHRRRGLAHRLLAEVAAPRTLLEVSVDNEAALAFYAAEGFTEIARRRRYYRDGSDALVLQRVAGPVLADPDGAARRVAGGRSHNQAGPPGSATIGPADRKREEGGP
jgi:ribosomal-protein-alanine N-acetyltransferase